MAEYPTNVEFGKVINGVRPRAQHRLPLDVFSAIHPGAAEHTRRGNRVNPRVLVHEPWKLGEGVTATHISTTMGASLWRDKWVNRWGSTRHARNGCPFGSCVTTCVNEDVRIMDADDRHNLGCSIAMIEAVYNYPGIETPLGGRFMFTPTYVKGAPDEADVVFIEDVEDPSPVLGGDGKEIEPVFYKVPSCHSLVFSESWMRSNCIPRMTPGFNGADASSLLVRFTLRIKGREEQFFAMICTERDNIKVGEVRSPLHRPLRATLLRTVAKYRLDRSVLEGLDVYVTVGSSATLKTFRHPFRVPAPEYRGADNPQALAISQHKGIDLREFSRRFDLTQRVLRDELEPGEDPRVLHSQLITPADVIDEQWGPNAIESGFVWGHDVVTGEFVQRTRGDCNFWDNGLYCHVDYRGVTELSLQEDTDLLGVNLHVDQSKARDSASTIEDDASNRVDQNEGGIPVGETARSFVGFSVALAS